MLVSFIYCIVVSSLFICSPSIDKPCTWDMSPDLPASNSLDAILQGESGVISYISILQENLLLKKKFVA